MEVTAIVGCENELGSLRAFTNVREVMFQLAQILDSSRNILFRIENIRPGQSQMVSRLSKSETYRE